MFPSALIEIYFPDVVRKVVIKFSQNNRFIYKRPDNKNKSSWGFLESVVLFLAAFGITLSQISFSNVAWCMQKRMNNRVSRGDRFISWKNCKTRCLCLNDMKMRQSRNNCLLPQWIFIMRDICWTWLYVTLVGGKNRWKMPLWHCIVTLGNSPT